MDQSVKFTVILPIYNVEKYLNRCVESVVQQSYRNLEIILVDDGAKDNCPELCDEWGKKDERIKVIHKKNAGLGEARNSGLELATGDYICFFDSDDYVGNGLFETAYKVILKENPDLIEFGHCKVNRNGSVTETFIPRMPQLKYEGSDVMKVFLPELICTDPRTGEASNLMMSAWSCIYKKTLLDRTHFRFVSERELICEDIYSLMNLMPAVDSVCIIQKAYYYYCENEQSLTHVYRPDRFDKILYFQQELEKLCSNSVYSDEVRYRIKRPFLDNLLSCLKGEIQCVNQVGHKRVLASLKKICKNRNVQNAIREMPGDSFSKSRNILHFLIKHKMVRGVFSMVKVQQAIKNRSGRND